MGNNQKSVIAVVGPTAVGKTAMGIRLAQHFHTEILSADSRQCYRELNIGVARPSDQELSSVPHHFIAAHSIHENLTAADYESYSLNIAETIFQSHDQIVLVGGTGLYVHAFLNGLDVIPSVESAIREQVLSIHAEKGFLGIEEELRRLDPWFTAEGEMKNPQRMMRALEVVMATGNSILSYRSGQPKQRSFLVKWVGLELPRAVLVDRINRRVEQMIEAGWLEEAQQLYPFRQLNALQTVGYKELFEHLEGKISLDEAIELIKIATRQYAKRQMTWFRKVPGMQWFSPDEDKKILTTLCS